MYDILPQPTRAALRSLNLWLLAVSALVLLGAFLIDDGIRSYRAFRVADRHPAHMTFSDMTFKGSRLRLDVSRALLSPGTPPRSLAPPTSSNDAGTTRPHPLSEIDDLLELFDQKHWQKHSLNNRSPSKHEMAACVLG